MVEMIPAAGFALVATALGVPPSNKFSFVIVLASIITALAIRSILTGVGWVVTCRRQVRLYFLHLIGATLVFLLLIQGWWGTFSKSLLPEWHFASYLVFLTTPILYYVVAELLFPSRKGPEIDFQKHYWENFRWFYGISAVIQLNNILMDKLMPTDAPSGVANAIRLSAFLLLLVMALFKSARIHSIVYSILISLFVVFVWMFNPKM